MKGNTTIILLIIVAAIVVFFIMASIGGGGEQVNDSELASEQVENSENNTEATEEASPAPRAAAPAPVAPSRPAFTATGERYVYYTSNGFDPITVTVRQGQGVIFKNITNSVLRVASDDHPEHTNYRDFNQSTISANGQEWAFTPLKIGTHGYHNENALWHKGTLVVTPQ